MKGGCIAIGILEHARELERELTEAQAYNNKVTKELWMWKHGEMRSERLIKELNATRAALEQMTEDAVSVINNLVEHIAIKYNYSEEQIGKVVLGKPLEEVITIQP